MRKYFVRANTSSGLVGLMRNNLNGVPNVYIIDGMSKTAKSRILELAAGHFDRKYPETECIHSPFDIRHIDAVIVRSIGFAAVDAECAEGIKGIKTINTDDFLSRGGAEASQAELDRLRKGAEKEYGELYGIYAEAKVIHDEWEKIYIENMDYARLNAYTRAVADGLLGGKTGSTAEKSFERFFGASTPDGSVNYIDNITKNLAERYFIKGRPGSGKSTFLKMLAAAAREKGFGADIYRCSFDKDSLDMTVIPELSVCVFDSTAPHELFPADKRDKILDFYRESGLEGTDERLERSLGIVSEKYRRKISQGLAHLRLGRLFDEEREYYLERAFSRGGLEREADKLIRAAESVK